jgi:hypothetical protein
MLAGFVGLGIMLREVEKCTHSCES